ISTFLGNGDGTFTPAPDAFTTFQPEFVTAGDFNRDGKPDLVIAYANTGLATVFFGRGDGTFSGPNDIPGLGSTFVTAADLNHDGVADLILPIVSSPNVELILAKGDGTFEAPIELAAPMEPSAIAVGDFNGDGQPDLAITNQDSNSVAIFLNTCVSPPSRKHVARH